MATIHIYQLRSLCLRKETFEKAKSLLHLAQTRTGPGSGYSLASGANGLPAICAHLASQALGNTDVPEHIAQSATCLDRKTFVKALNTVRAALQSQEPGGSQELTFETFVRAYKLTPMRKAIQSMEEVENTFLDNALTRRRYSTNVALLKCAVFYWTYSLMERVEPIRVSSLAHRYDFNPKPLKDLVDALDKRCGENSTQIRIDTKEVHVTHVSPLKMRNSASPTKSPSKSALRGRTLELTPAKALAQKRGVVFSQETLSGPDDDLQPETPSKRRRVESPVKTTGHTPHKRSHLVTPTSTSAFHLALSGTIHHAPPTEEPSPFLSTVNKIPPPASSPSTPRRTRKFQSNPAEPSYAMDVDEPEQREQPSRRRFRPIFLDNKQWCSRDPKLEAIWARAQRHVEGMTSLYGNPLQKYGHQHTAVT